MEPLLPLVATLANSHAVYERYFMVYGSAVCQFGQPSLELTEAHAYLYAG